MHTSVGSEVHLFVEAMPYLGKLLNVQIIETEEADRKGTEKSKDWFGIAFRRFLPALIDPEYPILLGLDHLQFSDEGSLDLLQSLASPTFGDRLGLLITGTYRDNEVAPNHPLSIHLRSLSQKERL